MSDFRHTIAIPPGEAETLSRIGEIVRAGGGMLRGASGEEVRVSASLQTAFSEIAIQMREGQHPVVIDGDWEISLAVAAQLVDLPERHLRTLLDEGYAEGVDGSARAISLADALTVGRRFAKERGQALADMAREARDAGQYEPEAIERAMAVARQGRHGQ